MNLELGEFIVMPNHFHGIVIIRNGTMDCNRGDRPIVPAWPITPTFKLRPKSLSLLMTGF